MILIYEAYRVQLHLNFIISLDCFPVISRFSFLTAKRNMTQDIFITLNVILVDTRILNRRAVCLLNSKFI